MITMQDIASKFGDCVLLNGLTQGQPKSIANGMGCFAAQLVAFFKEEPGNFYLKPPGATDCGEEFVYVLKAQDNHLHMQVFGGPMTAFGFPSEEGAVTPLWEGELSTFNPENVKGYYDD